jgi:uncharacterized protein (TIGR03083 family)
MGRGAAERGVAVEEECRGALLASGGVETEDYIAALRRDGARLAEAAADLTLPVPSCPEWTVMDLVWHVGRVHDFWRQMASGGNPDTRVEPARPVNAELVEWFADGVEATAEVLAGLDPETPAWTWSGQRDAGFIQRRMAQETAVHAWDALAAAGRDEPVERALAVDGIDELLTFHLSATPPQGLGSVHLHTTDGPGEWLIVAGEDGWRITPEHAKGDVAVRATASDLLLLPWRRKGPEVAQVFGDEEVLSRFLASGDLG